MKEKTPRWFFSLFFSLWVETKRTHAFWKMEGTSDLLIARLDGAILQRLLSSVMETNTLHPDMIFKAGSNF